MAMVLGALRFLLVLVLVRLLFRFGVAVIKGYRGGAAPRPVPVELVRDKVCNTYLPRDRALVATIAGRQEHFCSEACRDRALTLLPVP